MLDLGRLKWVNDNVGHDAGDRYIQRAADVLRVLTRDRDLLARLGGDEFGVIAVGASADQADQPATRIEKELDVAGVAGSAAHAPYSVVAGFPGALAAADEARYRRKAERRAGP